MIKWQVDKQAIKQDAHADLICARACKPRERFGERTLLASRYRPLSLWNCVRSFMFSSACVFWFFYNKHAIFVLRKNHLKILNIKCPQSSALSSAHTHTSSGCRRCQLQICLHAQDAGHGLKPACGLCWLLKAWLPLQAAKSPQLGRDSTQSPTLPLGSSLLHAPRVLSGHLYHQGSYWAGSRELCELEEQGSFCPGSTPRTSAAWDLPCPIHGSIREALPKVPEGGRVAQGRKPQFCSYIHWVLSCSSHLLLGYVILGKLFIFWACFHTYQIKN